jgi:DNA-binding beta-propeller fold protein YncE
MAVSVLSLQAATYNVNTRYPVAGNDGWDYIAVDSSARRLYVSHGTEVDVLDADTGKTVGVVADTPGVHGIAIASSLEHGFTTNGKENKVSMFDTRTLALIKKIDVGDKPDGIFFDSATQRVFTCNHGTHNLTVIDAASGTVVGTVDVKGDGEGVVAGSHGTLFVNLENTSEVVEIDPQTLIVLHRYVIQGGQTPTGLAMDREHDRLFIGCRSKSLIVMNATNGQTVASMTIGAGVDAAGFDKQAGLIFASNGDGTLNIIREVSPDQYEPLETVATQLGAKTMAFDGKTKKIYLPAAEVEITPSADPAQKPKRTVKDGTFAVLVVGKLASAPAEQDAPLRPAGKFVLPSAVKGPFDHLTADVKNGRLFATPESYQAVLVLDLNTGKVLQEIKGVLKPHAVLNRNDVKRIYVTDGEAGSLDIFDGTTYALEQKIALEKDADSIGFDPSSKLLYVVNGGKDAGQKFSLLSVIDTTADKKITDIGIDGDTLEAMALDTFRPRLYLNNPAKSEIEVIDRRTNKVIGSWPVTMGKLNVAMALDEANQRLFAGCRNGQVVVFDSNTGKELQSFPITTGVDDLTYDAASKRLYAAGNGFVDVIGQDNADHYKSLGRIEAGPLARTARLVSKLNRYYVAVPQSGSADASIAVFSVTNPLAAKPPSSEEAQAVDAPFAEDLVLATLSAHPELRKLGLHAVPPGLTDSLIIANGNASRIGFKSSKGDFDAVKDNKTYCARKDDGEFYNLKLPLLDVSGKRIGIMVMELPFTSVPDAAEAVRKAEKIQAEVAKNIPDLNRLFQNR